MSVQNVDIVTVANTPSPSFLERFKFNPKGFLFGGTIERPPNFVLIKSQPEEAQMTESQVPTSATTETPATGLKETGGVIQATKHDQGKPRFALIPKRAETEVAQVFTYGATKYDVGNWHAGDSFDWDKLISASDRHGRAFELGEDLDPETGYHHLAHKICCDMMLLELVLAGHGTDNRAKTQYLPDKEKADTKDA